MVCLTTFMAKAADLTVLQMIIIMKHPNHKQVAVKAA